MSGFIEWLEGLNEKDTRVKAVLRRSCSFDPGGFVPAYPYVEPFVKHEVDSWRREMHYLVAGLWAGHWREGSWAQPVSIGEASAALYLERDRSPSIERRFVSLLDADADQLPHRLRQMIALLKDHAIDFDDLLGGLLYWNHEQKRTQSAWARDFYRNAKVDTEEESIPQEEVTT